MIKSKASKESVNVNKTKKIKENKKDSIESYKSKPRKKKEELKDNLPYKFKNFYKSETKINKIDYDSDPEEILDAFSRLIQVFANNHSRESVEVEDLISEGQRGVLEAIEKFSDPATRAKMNYNFKTLCLYKIRTNIFQYCLRNANQIKTPYYIQRGCMHVSQIFKLMSIQSVAEVILGRPGPATEAEIIDFLYDEHERLPLKSLKFIKAQITKKTPKKEFDLVLSGVLNHERGSRHSYVKNNLTDVGKVLHIKNKIYHTHTLSIKNYQRIIDLILMARRQKVELSPILPEKESTSGSKLTREKIMIRGREICGDRYFEIFLRNKVGDLSYEELSKKYKIKKSEITKIIKYCTKLLQDDPFFQGLFKEL